ncbi:cyclin-dependent kinase inhibitor 1-like [Pseudophryne corroboree]|uniref:cyclin-dependent kinase inhibitor 1-like n=1 Tax=Pseudophryne corroboree TaxID=495146 RepID=UPI0030814EB6
MTENMRCASAILKSNDRVSREVCRNLFGPVDHERLKMDYKAAISESVEEAKRRWNFDFVNEVPLEGEFKWEKVEFPDTNGRKRKQKLITEFFQVKRRCSSFSKPV